MNNIQERLDRCVANIEWVSQFPQYKVEHLVRIASDHCPILLSWTAPKSRRGKKRQRIFRFEKMWLQDDSCKPFVKQAWNSFSGNNSPEHMKSKIHKLGASLLHWEATHFGLIRKQLDCARNQLEKIQALPPNANNIKAAKVLDHKITSLMRREETMWFQRSRANWIKDGDKNTAFFHKVASGRQKRNSIDKIMNTEGIWVDDHDGIADVLQQFYGNLFTSTTDTNFNGVLDAITSRMPENLAAEIGVPFTEPEIVAALSQMHPSKAPGPDGMPALFFQQFWSSIKNDIVGTILNILNNNADPSPLNHTHIILIPKKKNASLPSDFRPISLCNVIFKIITKVIANRIKPALTHIIHPGQSAFIPGRLITDNALVAFEIFHAMKHNTATKKGSFALKLDMSKAYDRVEWNFLHHVMLRIGLPTHIASLIMRCVSTVSYSVLTNGIPGNIFTPTRGLRQGDPLSPYLFLFCAEAFSSLISRSELAGRIHGFRICRRAPPVSHLFFADDSIIFGRANANEIQEVQNIITQYGEASGQLVNFEKSEINFSKGVDGQVALTLANRLGVQRVDKHLIYLGLPASVGRSKKSIFQSLVDRVGKKLKNWKAITLSTAGKMTLLKSVAQAIPTYIMSCFQIPIEICQKLNSLMASFWWGQKREERKIHWLQWHTLCKSKEHGGLGFRELSIFNNAMLAKQGWRLIHDENSLLAQTLKARYYPNGDFLTASIGYNPSFTWRSIVAGRDILRKGSRRLIGNGRSTLVWKDPWLPAYSSFRPSTNHGFYPDDMQVADLIREGQAAWNDGLIRLIFTQEEAHNILSIPLRNFWCEDSWTWHFTANGQYSVKSGYKIGLMMDNRFASRPSTSGNSETLWKWLWGLPVPPKVQVFCWKILHNVLPVRAALFKRKAVPNPYCERCGDGIETVEHALRDCPWSLFFWQASPLRLDPTLTTPSASMADMAQEIARLKNDDVSCLFVMLLWVMWYAKNMRTFQGKEISHIDCYSLAARCLQECKDGKDVLLANEPTITVHNWQRPREGFFKINTDASIVKREGSSFGVVIRAHNGEVIRVRAQKFQQEFAIDIMEAIACREGLKLAQELQLEQVEVETDCKTLVQSYQRHQINLTYLGRVIDDIRELCSTFKSCNIRYIPRSSKRSSKNTLAEETARRRERAKARERELGLMVCNLPRAIAMAVLS